MYLKREEFFIIVVETFEDNNSVVNKYFKGINIGIDGKFDIELTENPEEGYRFNALIKHEQEAKRNILNFCKTYFSNLHPQIKKLNITIE